MHPSDNITRYSTSSAF